MSQPRSKNKSQGRQTRQVVHTRPTLARAGTREAVRSLFVWKNGVDYPIEFYIQPQNLPSSHRRTFNRPLIKTDRRYKNYRLHTLTADGTGFYTGYSLQYLVQIYRNPMREIAKVNELRTKLEKILIGESNAQRRRELAIPRVFSQFAEERRDALDAETRKLKKRTRDELEERFGGDEFDNVEFAQAYMEATKRFRREDSEDEGIPSEEDDPEDDVGNSDDEPVRLDIEPPPPLQLSSLLPRLDEAQMAALVAILKLKKEEEDMRESENGLDLWAKTTSDDEDVRTF